MPLKTNQISVTTSATRLGFGPPFGPDTRCSVAARNRGSVEVFMGGSNVTTSNGVRVDPGETLTVELGPDEALFGIVASGTATCHVLQASGN